ncbi:MAG: putative ATP-dependent RNA helicase DHR1 [Thelocarpon impressellum]|nr:MAG: putative ATP-dependent RNA helicase DHR1 [Thelocarpon impressellum]
MPIFVPRQRKHKVRRRQGGGNGGGTDSANPNVAEILPASKLELEEKRQRLRKELRAQQPKISGKKQKRLDKYIDNKLRKEENLELIKRLAHAKVDTTLLRSSKTLGTSKESKRDVFSRALKERAAGIDVEKNNEVLLESRDNQAEDSENDSEHGGPHPRLQVPEVPFNTGVGSGLKRPLEVGEDGNPIIARKKRKKQSLPKALSNSQEAEWIDFASDDEAHEQDEMGLHDEDELSRLDSRRHSGASEGSAESSDEEENDSEMTSEESEEPEEARVQRSSAFKAWATQQVNEALGFQPSNTESSKGLSTNIKVVPRADEQDTLPRELQTTDTTREAFTVHVERTPEVLEARLALPVVAEEQKIMEAVHNNPVVVVWGATGSGKTTQLPQFLYEAGYGSRDGPTPGMIGITQPRRVAAVSMARRVGEELGKDSGKVAYKIRFEGSVNDKTAIKFMTDGILLREASEDITLSKYSAIVIDEAHERTKDTDILIGMMSRIVTLRADLSREDPKLSSLKLIIMSATLRISDFTENRHLFASPPPLVQAEGRQHHVTIHWARKTTHDYSEEAYRKVSKAHRRLPPGGILVFLTGQNEITHMAGQLKKAFPPRNASWRTSDLPVIISSSEAPLETEDMDLGDRGEQGLEESSSDEDETGFGGDRRDDDDFDIGESMSSEAPMHVLPLYSLLPTKEQLRVFEAPPNGSRLVVLATNVAETSLTIPGIRYVFDCGRAKERRCDEETGVQSFEVGWISKASASQRAGRAGRTGPGHCYRLYSSAIYERDFQEHAEPEILRTSIEGTFLPSLVESEIDLHAGVVLQIAALNIPNIINRFPFPTPPDRQRLAKAQKVFDFARAYCPADIFQVLSYLGALSPEGQLTELGSNMSTFPVSPRFAKMLLTGQGSSIPHTIAVVAALSVPDVFIPEGHLNITLRTQNAAPDDDEDDRRSLFTAADRLEEDARESRRKAYNTAHSQLSQLGGASDALKLLSAVQGHSVAADPDDFCARHFLRSKALREVQLLRSQLHRIVAAAPSSTIEAYSARLPMPKRKELAHLRKVLASGYPDQIAMLASASPNPPSQEHPCNPSRPTLVPYLPTFPAAPENPPVYIHPSSVLAHLSSKALPTFIIYTHLQRSSSSTAGRSTIRMHALTPLAPTQISSVVRGTPLLTYSKPIKPPTELTATTREAWVVPSLRPPDSAGLGWPLPAERVLMKRIKGVWIFKEVVMAEK